MGRWIATFRYLGLVGLLFGVLASVVAFGWGARESVELVIRLARGQTEGMAVGLVQVMDAFLIAAGLLIFALALYELFIGELVLPAALTVHSLDQLKTRLAGIVVMVMAVTFLERLETRDDPRDILYSGVAVTLVSAVLLALGRMGPHPPQQP